jgi:hypothetical protein
MTDRKPWTVFILVGFCVGAMFFAAHAYEERQTYNTGVYIGKSAFTAAVYQNSVCAGASASRRACEVRDLNRDSVMEDSLAAANIIPALADSAPLHTGFRDGWREAGAGAFTN